MVKKDLIVELRSLVEGSVAATAAGGGGGDCSSLHEAEAWVAATLADGAVARVAAEDEQKLAQVAHWSAKLLLPLPTPGASSVGGGKQPVPVGGGGGARGGSGSGGGGGRDKRILIGAEAIRQVAVVAAAVRLSRASVPAAVKGAAMSASTHMPPPAAVVKPAELMNALSHGFQKASSESVLRRIVMSMNAVVAHCPPGGDPTGRVVAAMVGALREKLHSAVRSSRKRTRGGACAAAAAAATVASFQPPLCRSRSNRCDGVQWHHHARR
eukprot:GHVU01085510.1.p1 GENE.GHVU01085510.1~~GHVU01085510.1.p1  ORF type:complete len:269 (+),score=35.08 GHVU01085510.1:372-1178(+)